MRAMHTTWVRGQVFDKKTKEGLPSLIELTDLDTRNTVSNLQTDEDGNYLVTLPAGRQYAFNVNRKGYLFHSENFNILPNKADSFILINIPLQPIEKGAAIVLKNIFFDNNEFALKPASLTELEKVVALLRENPSLSISIEGHTDNVGSDADNLKLSLNRAKSVTTYLVSQGIDPKRLTHKGYGSTLPIAPNSTHEGKALNRRTEMKVTSQ
jgi:outer membrane protein OmpA-like peptidoglycan-associated protein